MDFVFGLSMYAGMRLYIFVIVSVFCIYMLYDKHEIMTYAYVNLFIMCLLIIFVSQRVSVSPAKSQHYSSMRYIVCSLSALSQLGTRTMNFKNVKDFMRNNNNLSDSRKSKNNDVKMK